MNSLAEDLSAASSDLSDSVLVARPPHLIAFSFSEIGLSLIL